MNEADCLTVDELKPARRALRIAVVTETYPPEVNGVALTIACFVRGLVARQHDVQLIRPRQANAGVDATRGLSEVLMRGLPIPRYPDLRMGMPAKNALIRMWTRQRPDLVHIVTEGPLGWSALQAAKRLKLPVTSDFRTNFHAYSRHYGMGWLSKPIFLYLRKFHNRTDCTMVPTLAMKRELEDAGFRNVSVVARGVDTRRFDPVRRSEALRASWGAKPEDMVALCVGRLAPEKNLSAVFSAFTAMRNQNANIRLVLVGDGPARDDVTRRCPEALLAGMKTGAELAEHYASADAFLFPSLTETYGNVTPEAMASGLPVVAYNYAAASQLIRHGRNGMLASLDRSDDFMRHAAWLAAHPDDARAMGAAARQTASENDWDRIVGQLEDVFANVLDAHDAGRIGHSLALAG
ncbi:MAG: glycosyltransferase family 1 protein [Betaproteobacteria bacterium]|nr:glycosyltransferase family 1 protein [Betaproteobacteria bacterium]